MKSIIEYVISVLKFDINDKHECFAVLQSKLFLHATVGFYFSSALLKTLQLASVTFLFNKICPA